MPHISTGDIFRAHIQGGTTLGREAKQYLDTGALVPDALVCELVESRLSESDCAHGYILDGFPRSVPQAEALDHFLGKHDKALDIVIVLVVPDDEVVERLAARRTCPVCGAIYNLKFNPPRRNGYCNNEANTPLVQREDDHEETIRHRLKVYRETTQPLLAYYGGRGLVYDVDGSGLGPDAIFAKIESIISDIGAARVR
jgi:adenylate kinase